MQKTFLSIMMPSNRDFQSSDEAVHSALVYCKKTGTQFVVSDNSGDPAKEKGLAGLMQGEGLRYIKTPPCGMIENWSRAFNATEGEFVMMMGDDDRLFSFAPPPDFGNIGSDVVAIKPCLFAYTDAGGIRNVDFNSVEADKPQDRIVENLKASANGCNLGIFSFWRRTVLKSIFDLWFIHHPTKGNYLDWAAMNALVSSGKAVINPSLCYFYNLHHWAAASEVREKKFDNGYVISGGLPAGSGAYAALFNAIDSYIFINRKDSPLNENERGLAAIFCLNLYLKLYINNLPVTSQHENAPEIAKLSKKLIANDSVPEIFALFADILEAIRPNLGKQYRQYHQEAVGKSWGVF